MKILSCATGFRYMVTVDDDGPTTASVLVGARVAQPDPNEKATTRKSRRVIVGDYPYSECERYSALITAATHSDQDGGPVPSEGSLNGALDITRRLDPPPIHSEDEIIPPEADPCR